MTELDKIEIKKLMEEVIDNKLKEFLWAYGMEIKASLLPRGSEEEEQEILESLKNPDCWEVVKTKTVELGGKK